MNLLEETLAQIQPLDEIAIRGAEMRWNSLCMGAGDAGKWRDMIKQYAGITGEILPEVPKKCMIIAAADHGVAKYNLSAYPVETTVEMTKNYLRSQGAGANAMAVYAGADMVVADLGIMADMSAVEGLLDYKIAWGTQDMTVGPAMTREQAIKSIEAGIDIINKKIAEGYRVFSVGEMGISNTTAAATIIAVFAHWQALETTGRGTNISDERLQRKIEVVQQALEVNRPDAKDGLDVLAKIGGFEFGAIAGVIFGAAASKAMVIIDGFNTTAAAHIAQSIAPESQNYIMASHRSAEQAHQKALETLQLEPYLDLGFRLGEASGASIQMRMFDHALAVYLECLTVEELRGENNG